MNLLNKTCEKLKYFSPTAEIIDVNNEDIITSSGEMAELKFSKKSKKNKKVIEKQPAIKDMPLTEMPVKQEQPVFQKYPNGLPLEVLELIDFKHFGAKLKQEQLLPPSYSRKPIEIDLFLDAENIPNVELVFKSKTSSSYRIVNIHKHNVACSKNRSYALAVNSQISEVWCEFAQNVMWAWERGYNYALVGPEKNIETYGKLRVDEVSIARIKEIESECKKFCNVRDI